MNCPGCDSITRVIRSTPGSGLVKRRRECTSCGRRFGTSERTDDAEAGADAKRRCMIRELIEITDTYSG